MFGIISVAQEFPLSLAAIRPRIPESGAAQTSYLELREGGTLVWFLRCALCGDPLTADQSWVMIGDQSLAWCRISIAVGLSLCYFFFFTPHSPSCVSASTLAACWCVCRLLLDEKKKKKVRTFLRPETETD